MIGINFFVVYGHSLQMNDAVEVVALLPELILEKSHRREAVGLPSLSYKLRSGAHLVIALIRNIRNYVAQLES